MKALTALLIIGLSAPAMAYNYDETDQEYIERRRMERTTTKHIEGVIRNAEGDELYYDGTIDRRGNIDGYDQDGNRFEMETNIRDFGRKRNR